MLVADILNEMASGKITKSHIVLSRNFAYYKIKTHFSKHFSERSLDGTFDEKGRPRGDAITYDEFMYTMDKFMTIYKQSLIKKSHWAGIIHDESSHLNIIFRMKTIDGIKQFDFITIMKKEDFKPGNFKFYYV